MTDTLCSEAQSKAPCGSSALQRQAFEQRVLIACPPQDVQQPEPSQPEDPFSAPVMAIKQVPLAVLQTSSGQMGDPPQTQEQHQEQPIQPGSVSNAAGFQLPAATFTIEEGGFYSCAPSVFANPLASGWAIRDQQPGVLMGWLPDGAELGFHGLL